jgi:hypothetical protein
MAFSQFDLKQMQARLSHNALRNAPADMPAAERETGPTGLHRQVVLECELRGWLPIYNRTDKKSTSSEGVVDIVVAADRGRTFYVELKSKTGKQSIAQRCCQAVLEKNGHTYHLVRSFEQFLSIVDGSLAQD